MAENKTGLTILVDIDDTIENLCEEWVDILNKKHGTNVCYEDVTEWDISKFFPELTKAQVFEPLHTPDIWYSLSPKDGAIRNIKKLIEDGHDVFLCTSTDYRNIKYKFVGVIARLFPFIDWSHVIVANHKQMILGDIMIDDAPHNLEDGSYIKILMTAPHNKSYDVAGKGIIRCDTWDEIYEVIDNLVNLRKPHLHSVELNQLIGKVEDAFSDAEKKLVNVICAGKNGNDSGDH